MSQQVNKYDVLVVGSGIAGLSQAIALAEKDASLSIGVVSKSKIEETNTRLAQGGIAAVMSIENDSYDSHIKDTLQASQNLADIKTVKHVVEHAHEGIHKLENWGVEFDKINAEYHFGLEGGHSFPRILHVKDQTGAAVHASLLKTAEKCTSISLLNDLEIIKLLKNSKEELIGAVAFDFLSNQTKILYSKVTVLATGGMGQLFEYTTNSSVATGDGILLAANIGATISNIQAIQFHPTAFKEPNKSQLFLISEAVRGAGAFIVNEKGERFVLDTDKRGELATRDIVSKAIYKELSKREEAEVFLDCRHISKAELKDEFPFIYDYCFQQGYDLSESLVPIIPAAHYSCGGIRVNLNGETNIPNLYALGECANTGLHGNNRLASNSLLEAVVLTFETAKHIVEKIDNIQFSKQDILVNDYQNDLNSGAYKEVIVRMKSLLSSYFISNSEIDRAELEMFLSNFPIEKTDSSLSLSKMTFLKQLNLTEMLLKDRIQFFS